MSLPPPPPHQKALIASYVLDYIWATQHSGNKSQMTSVVVLCCLAHLVAKYGEQQTFRELPRDVVEPSNEEKEAVARTMRGRLGFGDTDSRRNLIVLRAVGSYYLCH